MEFWHEKRGRKPLLTGDQVRMIRTSGAPVTTLALELSVPYQVVYSARYGFSWKEITDPAPWARERVVR